MDYSDGDLVGQVEGVVVDGPVSVTKLVAWLGLGPALNYAADL